MSSRKASTSWMSKPRSHLTVNCCWRISSGLMRIAAGLLPDLGGDPVQHRDQEFLQEVKHENHDHGREVEPELMHRQPLAHRSQHRLGHPVQEAHEGVGGVGAHPRKDRPRDDDPDVGDDDQVDEVRQRDEEVIDDEHHFGPCPSSRERWVARSTALMNVVRIPPSSSAAMPAIEVPPGEQTISLTAPGWSPVSRSSVAAPRTVWVARVIAVIRSSPIRTPPSASDSITTAMYAGPEPDRPVTASISSSPSTTTRPTALKISPAVSRSPASSPSAFATAVTPSRTRAGVFGITRMRRASLCRSARIFAVETPAAIEIKSFRRVTAGAISVNTASMICGFTARITMSAWRISSALSDATWIPYWRLSSLRRSRRTSVAWIASAGTRFAARSPLMSASPMLPAPTKPTLRPLIVIVPPVASDEGGDPPHLLVVRRSPCRPGLSSRLPRSPPRSRRSFPSTARKGRVARRAFAARGTRRARRRAPSPPEESP